MARAALRKLTDERAAGGLLWLVVSGLVIAESVRLGVGSFQRPGPGFVSAGAGILLAIQGIALLAGALARTPEAPAQVELASWSRPAVTVVALFAYATLLPVLGFVVASLLFLFGLLVAFPSRRWARSAAIAASAVGVTYVVFVVLLKVRMPAGILGLG